MPVIIKTRPGGSTTQVQFNDGGAFAGQADFEFAKATGSFVAGLTYGGTLTSSGKGSVAIGSGGYNSGLVEASGQAAFAGGYGGSNSSYIKSLGYGSFAFGSTAYYDGKILANDNGAFALGHASSYGRIRSIEDGSFAMGYAITGSAQVYSSKDGAFAMGHASNAEYIRANGLGSFAMGKANGYNILTSGKGSLAIGYSYVAAITASADNSAQFGPGTNSQADSLSVGTTVRLKGTTGVPTSVRNGDMWVSSNYVYIRSNGSSVKIT